MQRKGGGKSLLTATLVTEVKAHLEDCGAVHEVELLAFELWTLIRGRVMIALRMLRTVL